MPLRIATWNVNMALARKRSALQTLRADVAVLQEVARDEMTPRRSVWVGNLSRKGLGVEVADGYTATIDPSWDPRMEFVLPCRVSGPTEFILLAVWAMNHRATTKYPEVPDRQQLLQAMDVYEPLIRSMPCVIAGDFNNAIRWDRPGKASNHAATVERATQLGLVSAYHTSRNTPHGAEPDATLYWVWNEAKPYHIDYVFIPADWAAHVTGSEVGTYRDWVAHRVSDHVPVVVELATPLPYR